MGKGAVGHFTFAVVDAATKKQSSSSSSDRLPERIARLAGPMCLTPTPICYHAIRFLVVVGLPLISCCALKITYVTTALVGKMIVWSVATELAGFGGGDGQLGDGHTLWTPCWFRLTRGTLRQTPFADPLATAVGVRGLFDVALFVFTMIVSIFALTPYYETTSLQTFTVAYTLLCLRDYSSWTGGQGKHYYPLLVSLSLGGSITGCQIVQFAHIFFSGVAKCGPWWINVSPTMFGNAPCLPKALRSALFVDATNGECTPNRLAILVAIFGACTELFGPISWLFGGGIASRGVKLVAMMHLYIILANPMGAIAEWNFVNLVLEWWLFSGNEARGAYSVQHRCDASIPLLAFLIISQIIAPIAGNIRPDSMSYLMAIRNYTGNHATHFFAARKKALNKLDRIPTAFALSNDTNAYNRPLSTPPCFDSDGLLGGLGTMVRARGICKPLGWILEECMMPRHLQEYVIIALPHFVTATATAIDPGSPALLRALVERCDLRRGDLLSLRISSFPLFPTRNGTYRTHWSVVDAIDTTTAAAPGLSSGGSLGEGEPRRWGFFGRTTSSLLWDLAFAKGVIETRPIAGFVRAEATARRWDSPESDAKTFDALGREIVSPKSKTN